jgi:N-acetylmuramoyl-L-alanine amidase
MARTIFLSAGHGGTDPGAVANGFIERDLAIELRQLIANELKNTFNVTARMDPNQNRLIQTLNWLKGKFLSKDILFDIHWNAGGGTGIEIIVPDNSSSFERSLSQNIVDRIASITGWKRRGLGGVKKESETPRKRLGWMRPNAENILIEVCFIDNKTDMAVYQSNKLAIAKAIANSLYNFSKI